MSYPRTSPIHSELEKLKPVWGDLYDMKVPLSFGEADAEEGYLKDLALCDLSALRKLGVKGEGSAEWLANQQIPIPERVYDWAEIEGGGLIARIDRNEFILEEGLCGTVVENLSTELGRSPQDCYRVERQDAGLLLVGARAKEVLGQTCSYNFEAMESKIVMTRVAIVSCAILPMQLAGTTAFRLWFIPSYGVYLWENLLQIVRDLGGGVVGTECLKK